MCGRFALTTPQDAVAEHFDASLLANADPGARQDIRPTQDIAVILSTEGGRRVVDKRWGFLPHWYKATNGGPLLINARAETVAGKPAFAKACRERRCLIPGDAFYEWQAVPGAPKKRVHRIARPGGGLFAFAGIWQDWQQGEVALSTVAIVTCAANATLAPVHHRMPVTVLPEHYALWLGEAGHGAATLMHAASDGYFAAEADCGPVQGAA